MKSTLVFVFNLLLVLRLPADEKPATEPPKWNVRVEALVVTLSQEKALDLLREFNGTVRAEPLYPRLLTMISRKEAELVASPTIWTTPGKKTAYESILERRYYVGRSEPSGKESKQLDADLVPDAEFETRNVGVTLEVEPVVREGGAIIDLEVGLQHVVLLEMEAMEVPVSETASISRVAKVQQPIFTDRRTQTRLALKSGEWILLASHKLEKPANTFELSFIKAEAIPTATKAP